MRANADGSTCSGHSWDRNEYRGVRALVLGASGFVGSCVARHLWAAGAQVVLGVRDRAAGDALAAGLHDEPEVRVADLCDRESLVDLLGEVAPDVTFNMAAYGVDAQEQDSALFRRVNGELPGWLCDRISKLPSVDWRGLRLVHAGTVFEYGACGGSLAEEAVPRPTTRYGRTKLDGTASVVDWVHDGRLAATTVRLFSLYGDGEHDRRLLPSLIRAAAGADDIELTEGLQLRDFCYVEDVADGLLRIGAARNCPVIVNLATGRLTSVRGFVEEAASVLGIASSRLRFGALPTRQSEMEHDPVSLGRLRRLVSWVPSTSLREGIRRTLECGEARAAERQEAGSMEPKKL